jgi:hypothetical protein
MKRTTDEAITPAAYRAFQEAYDFFSAELFGGSLPQVLVTSRRRAKAQGHLSPERFAGRTEDAAAHSPERAQKPPSPGRKRNAKNTYHEHRMHTRLRRSRGFGRCQKTDDFTAVASIDSLKVVSYQVRRQRTGPASDKNRDNRSGAAHSVGQLSTGPNFSAAVPLCRFDSSGALPSGIGGLTVLQRGTS